MKEFLDRVERGLRSVLLVFVYGIVLVVFLQIVARFIFLISVPWTDELARYLMIWAGFIGLGVAYRKKELICVSVFVDKLPKKLFKVTLFVSDILCSIFAMIVVIYGVKLCTLNVAQLAPTLRISLAIVYAAIPVGCAIFLLFSMESMIAFLKRSREE